MQNMCTKGEEAKENVSYKKMSSITTLAQKIFLFQCKHTTFSIEIVPSNDGFAY